MNHDFNKFTNNHLYDLIKDDQLFLFKSKTTSASYIFTCEGQFITSFTSIHYVNTSARDYLDKLSPCQWDELIITQSFEGPSVTLFYYNKWYICTFDSLCANSYYGDNRQTIYEYCQDVELVKNIENLDKKYCYHFILLHHKLKNIVQYNFESEYAELILIDIDIKGVSKKDLEFKLPITYNFSCLKELDLTLDKISHESIYYKRLSTEGFLIKHNKILMKIQTDIYIELSQLKPIEQNNYQTFLKLYQKDKLAEVLPYVSKYSHEIIHRIDISMKNMSREILNLYHITRKKNNSNIYESLPEVYKKILYEIHGMYIRSRKRDFVNGLEINKIRAVKIYNIYYFLKRIAFDILLDLYLKRRDVINNPLVTEYVNRQCIYTLTQMELMFK